MSETALAEPGETKAKPRFAKLAALRETISSRFPATEFNFVETSGGNAVLYIKHEDHCLRIEKRFMGYGFTDIADKDNLSLGPDCEFKEDLPLLTRHIIQFISCPRDR